MGLIDKIVDGLRAARQPTPGSATSPRPPSTPQDAPAGTAGHDGGGDDAAAIERYRYMLRTASPEVMEQAHAEAFARLTPEQRQQILAQVGDAVPAHERALSSGPQDLARMATRAEISQPGLLERVLARPGVGGRGMGMGMGMGGLLAGGLLGSVAGGFLGGSIARELSSGDGAGGGWGPDGGGGSGTDGGGWGPDGASGNAAGWSGTGGSVDDFGF